MTLAVRTPDLELDMSRQWMTTDERYELCSASTRRGFKRIRSVPYAGGMGILVVDERETEVQLSMFPTLEDTTELVENAALNDLREFTIAIMEIVIDLARRTRDLDVIRLLNGWIATLEETIAAGDDLEEILSRRRYVKDHALA